MFVYVIRHAWAEEADGEQFPDDDLRPLTAEGRERFAAVVKTLAQRDLGPQVIATSPLVRCRQTADVLAELLPKKPTVVELDALRPGSDFASLAAWTAEQGETDVAWVGHAPDVSRLTAALIGQGDCLLRFAKGTVAAVRFDEAFNRGRGELVWLATAKILGC